MYYSPITSPDETTDAEQAPPPPTVQGCCSPHESYSSPAVAADPIVGIDQLLSDVAATHVTTHVVFHDPPASPEPPHAEHGCSSALQESADVVLNIATTSDRALTIVVVEDDDTPSPPPPPQPQQANDVTAMRAACALKADRVSYINNDSEMLKVAYTRRWVTATTKSPAKQSASDWTWASTSTSSEMSATSTLQDGIATTIARQVRGRLAGRTVSRDDVAFRVHRELSDVFYMAMLPEFQDSIIYEVFNPATL